MPPKKKENIEGITVKKEEDFAKWYTQIITKAELIEYYDISGCFILRPWSYTIWEQIKSFFDCEIKKLGVQNAYFPLLVSQAALTKEEDHIAGFEAEVAWVTKSGKKDLELPVAIRPTSETIMYPAYKQWIRSHRDLPLKLNQWTNIVRWEFKDAVPFLRSREFLWQEGHSAFATKEEADEEVTTILDLYRQVYEDLLAVPTICGRKSEKEKFAGGSYTTTVEAFIPTNGRAIQAATSHSLGQNFAKMFKIEFEDTQRKKQMPHQNSWGITTRTIGVCIMVHGDDKGLVLPPKVAPIQVVIIPLYFKKAKVDVDQVAKDVQKVLVAAGISVKVDDGDIHNPGYKYNHWELKGVPLRIEIGPRDVENNQVVAKLRVEGIVEEHYPAEQLFKGKVKVPYSADATDSFVGEINKLLDLMQKQMLVNATKVRDDHLCKVLEWKEFVPELNKKNIVLAPWCDEIECEEEVKKKSGLESAEIASLNGGFTLSGSAKTLCIPFKQDPLPDDAVCFACSKKAKHWTLWGRSY